MNVHGVMGGKGCSKDHPPGLRTSRIGLQERCLGSFGGAERVRSIGSGRLKVASHFREWICEGRRASSSAFRGVRRMERRSALEEDAHDRLGDEVSMGTCHDHQEAQGTAADECA